MEEWRAEGPGGAEAGAAQVTQETGRRGHELQPLDLVVTQLGCVEHSVQPEAAQAQAGGMPAFVEVRIKQEPVDMDEAAGVQDHTAGDVQRSAPPEAALGPELAARVKREPVEPAGQGEPAWQGAVEAAGPGAGEAAGPGPGAGEAAGPGPGAGEDARWEFVFVKQEPADEEDARRPTAPAPGHEPTKLVYNENMCIKVEVEFERESETADASASETASAAKGRGERKPGALGARRGGGAPPRPPQPSECPVCHRAVSSLSKLKEHMRVHTGEKPYTCDTCRKGFTQMSHLKKHVRIHTGEKPYTCDICRKDFTLLDSLKIHQRIHTGEKPYSCKMCEKKFGDLSTLKRHGRIHTQEKPYTCNICQKAFAQLGSLKVHERTHTGEKPFKCEVCNKKFSESGTLKRHERIHTGEKPYSCEICERAFTELGCLNKHRRTHNKDNSSSSVEWGAESHSGGVT